MNKETEKNKYTTIRVTTRTMEELRKLRAWLELSSGKRCSIEKTIREMATEFNKAVTIPWGEVSKHRSRGADETRDTAVPPVRG
jgi:hypothetical protein